MWPLWGMPIPFLFRMGYWSGTFGIQIYIFRGWDSSVQQNMPATWRLYSHRIFFNSFGEPKPIFSSTHIRKQNSCGELLELNEQRNEVGMPPNVYCGQNMHQVIEYHEHSYIPCFILLYQKNFYLFILRFNEICFESFYVHN